jgi:hypothetical protein
MLVLTISISMAMAFFSYVLFQTLELVCLIMQAALDLIYELQLENLCDFDAILALLDTCIALGVPCDQTDANGL